MSKYINNYYKDKYGTLVKVVECVNNRTSLYKYDIIIDKRPSTISPRKNTFASSIILNGWTKVEYPLTKLWRKLNG